MPSPPDASTPAGARTLSRRSSRVRLFREMQLDSNPSGASEPVQSSPAGPSPAPGTGDLELPPVHTAPERWTHARDPQWQFPVYNNNYPSGYPGTQPPAQSSDAPRKASDASDVTLLGSDTDETNKMTFSSYRHPFDIKPPPQAYDSLAHAAKDVDRRREVANTSQEYLPEADLKNWDEELGQETPRIAQRRPGYLGNLLQLYGLEQDKDWEIGDAAIDALHQREVRGTRRVDSLAPEEDQFIDPDDPIVTGKRASYMFGADEEMEKSMLRDMSYKQRRKERNRMRIEFNITSMAARETFLTKLAQALMVFGAPSHRIESQLLSAAHILEVDAEFIHIPGVIICSFGDTHTRTTETHFVKCSGRLSLGSLHQVHQVYRKVVHDEISASAATRELEDLMNAAPIYHPILRCALALLISALICPLAFGGSFIDMWIAGMGSVVLCLMQISTAAKSSLYQNVFEVSVTILISFVARGLSSIPSQIFCYTAISSAGVVCILPGYLILTSSLELASKNIVCGSVKMVYALIYTLFLGFGLQIGSDLYLLVDRHARDDLTTAVSSNVQNAFTLSGKYWTDNSTVMGNNTHFFHSDGPTSFTFTNVNPIQHDNIVVGCYRPSTFPWYLKPFPWWTQFILVPVFSLCSSLGNLQPLFSVDLIVMILISCASYTANKVANHYIFQRSDVVSAIGAFVVGVLGNVYSRKMGGTAFTVMVTGVLFLVPSGLSQAGGITAQGDGIEIGNAMVAVTIGITVGLFMSQAMVYMFGSRKNAAIFSF